jgi:DNA-binding HxlR family transcriptional regulator
MSATTRKRRGYGQFCGAARALDVVGERWTLLIVRNLLIGPRRFSDLLDELPGITTNLLATRLRDLVAAELVEPAARGGYRLTEAGRALEPVVRELGRWGGRYMDRPHRGDAVNLGWGLFSLKRRYRGGVECIVGIEADGKSFELTLGRERMDLVEREAASAELRLAGTSYAFRRLFGLGIEPASIDELLEEKAITAAGDLRHLRPFARSLAP